MDGLRELGVDVWFALGDRDLAFGLDRARALDEGERLTVAQGRIAAALGVRARVLPMSDLPVRTRVLTAERWWPLQEFMIVKRGAGPVLELDFRHADAAPPTPEVLDAIAAARAVVIGPSNPFISIGPILALPGLRAALVATSAPVVAVSPLVGGRALKGPTEAFMSWAGRPLSSDGVAACYEGLIDGLVADGPGDAVPVLEARVELADPNARRRVAAQTLDFAHGLQSRGGRRRLH